MQEAYDTTNGVLELHIGKQTRTLIFRRLQMYVLAKRLGSDPINFINDGGDEGVFIAESISAGLSKDTEAKKQKVNPLRAMTWLDELHEEAEAKGEVFDEDELKIALLYAMAMGKPKAQAETMVQLLDEMFSKNGGKETPTQGASASSMTESASTSRPPPTD